MFTADELARLNKGLKYNWNYKPKNWIQTSEAETAVNFLPVADQHHFRWQIARNINDLYLWHSKFKGKNALGEKML